MISDFYFSFSQLDPVQTGRPPPGDRDGWLRRLCRRFKYNPGV